MDNILSNLLEKKPINVSIRTPSNIFIAGASGSGKTEIVYNLIKFKKNVFESPPDKIFYYYSEWQPKFDLMMKENLVEEFIKQTPDIDSLKKKLIENKKKNFTSFIIFDDLLHDGFIDVIANAFTVLGSKFKTTFCFISQVLYHPNTNFRIMSENAHYIFLTKTIRNKRKVSILASQLNPYNGKGIIDAYNFATEDKPYGYLLIDCHNKCSDEFRYKTDIFPIEKYGGIVLKFYNLH